MAKKSRKQELAEQAAAAIDAEAVPADAAPQQITLDQSVEQINKAFEAINANTKTFAALIDQDLKTIGGNIQLLINAVNQLATENQELRNPKPE